jgi:hypothetical protein
VAALQALVLAGLPPGSIERLVGPGGVGLLLEDRSPAVREASLRMLGAWLGAGSSTSSTSSNGSHEPGQQQQQQGSSSEGSAAAAAAAAVASVSGEAVGVMLGTERCQVYAPHLLPLLLLGLTDPEPALAELSLQQMEEVGRVWAAGAPPQQLETAAAAAGLAGHDRGAPAAAASDGAVPMDTSDTPTATATAAAAAAPSQQEQEQRAVAAALLPAPFVGLPGEGCRLMGASLLPGLLPRLVRELGEWTSRARAGAARWVTQPSGP